MVVDTKKMILVCLKPYNRGSFHSFHSFTHRPGAEYCCVRRLEEDITIHEEVCVLESQHRIFKSLLLSSHCKYYKP